MDTLLALWLPFEMHMPNMYPLLSKSGFRIKLENLTLWEDSQGMMKRG